MTKEYESQINRLESRTLTAEERLRQFKDQMGEIEDFTEELAIHTCLTHHNLILNLHTTERRYLEEVTFSNEYLYPKTLEEIAYTKLRMKQASLGDYSAMRRYYNDQGKSMMANAKGNPLYLIQGTSYQKLAQALPKNLTPDERIDK